MSMTRKQFLGSMMGAAAAAVAPQVLAQSTVTLRLHHFMAPQGPIPKYALAAWAEKIKKDSNGRIRVQLFPAMQLGGRPQDLFDQAKDGVVDLVWTILGYTPGRFPKTEVFELPFMVGKAEKSSPALYEYIQKNAMDEFSDVKLLLAHTHGAGLFHSRRPITKLEDLKGMKVRGGSRVINIMLEQLGAVAIGMPVPQIGEALSKGVIDATTLTWEAMPAYRLQQIVKNHTEFSGDRGLYTQTFALLMNKNSYAKLPTDLQAIIDANSGIEAAKMFGKVMDEYDLAGIKAAQDAKNSIITLNPEETQRWKTTAADRTRKQWLSEMSNKGVDGAKLLADAERLIAQYAAQ